MQLNQIADFRDDGPGMGATAILKQEYEVTAEVAELLAGHDGPVEVWDIMIMPEEFAEVIVNHNGKGLQFNHNNAGGPMLSNRAAEILATYNGELIINDIDSLNYGEIGDEVEIAKALAKHKGTLVLGITQISTEAAIELSKHEGPLYVEGLNDEASDEVLAILENAQKN